MPDYAETFGLISLLLKYLDLHLNNAERNFVKFDTIYDLRTRLLPQRYSFRESGL